VAIAAFAQAQIAHTSPSTTALQSRFESQVFE
jgi:hypothetical protein